MASKPRIWKVSELTAELKRLVEGSFPMIDVEGEIFNYKRQVGSGHCYFSLKDDAALIPAVLFRWDLESCLAKGLVTEAQLKDGAKVKVRGSVSVYPQRGACQVVVRRIRAVGEGELMQRYLELKARLESEGVFAAHKRPLPFMPRHIGIVTSESGAVIHDMCRVLTRRFPALSVRLWPCLVQGESAPASVIAGLDYFNSRPETELIIVARGGGSFEDLFCFNDERLVRAVAASRVPVISAVGHESDFTLCDFAADRRAGTPSIAAEIAVPVLSDLQERLALLSRRFGNSLRAKGENFEQRLDNLSEALVRGLVLYRERAERRLERAADRLELLSPYSVLDRGYSLTTLKDGTVVRDADALEDGDLLLTRLNHGIVESKVCL